MVLADADRYYIVSFVLGLIDPALVQVRIARIFNTYGPRMCIDDGRVVSNFVAQVGRPDKPVATLL